MSVQHRFDTYTLILIVSFSEGVSMSHVLTLPSNWLNHPIRILLLGAGGTGGEILHGLVRIHTMLIALDHPGGLEVTLMDGDTFSRWNVGRQRCYLSDIDHNKACVLIQRINIAYGLSWQALQSYWSPEDTRPECQ